MSYFERCFPSMRFPIAKGSDPGFREAQVAAAHALSAHFYQHRSEVPAVVVMPTGAGKTCVMMLLPFVLRARRLLIVTPSRMVREQIAVAFESLRLFKAVGALPSDGPCPSVTVVRERIATDAHWSALEDADVVVATVSSVSTGVEGVAAPPAGLFDVVCCDEAHHTPAPSWAALLNQFQTARRALFTATPFRRDARLLPGQVVFEYSLARAREDGVFGRLKYEPITPDGPEGPDVAIAQATERRLRADRKRGLKHLVMVRTAARKRALELARLYESHTSLRLLTVFGDHGLGRLKQAVEGMTTGALDGVICVDMFGEGFDLPNLKIAALHSPHRSLAVTLQFIGRFARTTAKDAGDATFLAVPAEIAVEAERLYVVGAEWNEIVEEASRRRIEMEQETRAVLETFAEVEREAPRGCEEEIDLAMIMPFFHAKVYQVAGSVDLTRPLPIDASGEAVVLRRSEEHNAVVAVTRDVCGCRWSGDDRLADVRHELFVLFYEPDSRLLFVCTSRRDNAMYDALIEAVVDGVAERLSPEEVSRVLRGISGVSFFSVGMRSRTRYGHGESYRMISGPSADRVIQRTDGRFYDRGHAFGRGDEGGDTVTIGFSSASKVWANRRGRLPDLFRWCRELARKLADGAKVSTKSGIDNLPCAQRIVEFPGKLVAVEWHEYVFRHEELRLCAPDAIGGAKREWPLLDCACKIMSQSSNEVVVDIAPPEHAPITVVCRLGGVRLYAMHGEGSATVVSVDGGRETPVAEFLSEHPFGFFSSDLARVEGNALVPRPESEELFDPGSIEVMAWETVGVDPLREKPDAQGAGMSLFEWLEARLVSSDASVVFNDDGAGELADYIAVRQRDAGRAEVELYHCKAASGTPVPGDRVEDVYEVVGQAVKSARYSEARALRKRLIGRMQRTKAGAARLVKGSEVELRALLADEVAITCSVFVVQPGIGAAPGRAQSDILAAANCYLVSAQVRPLRVIGSAAVER